MGGADARHTYTYIVRWVVYDEKNWNSSPKKKDSQKIKCIPNQQIYNVNEILSESSLSIEFSLKSTEFPRK
jgi:hypothetical protein